MEYTIGLYKTELINNLKLRKTLASMEVATAECNAPAGSTPPWEASHQASSKAPTTPTANPARRLEPTAEVSP